jgi:hypothetical protein
MQEKVYVKTEDTSGGACLNFLKKIFNTLIASSSSILCLANYGTTNMTGMEIFSLSANEMLVAMGYLLEIEYEVIGEDLVNLWLILLSYSAVNCNMPNAFDRCSLSSTIPALGCQIVNLYSQLRQVCIRTLIAIATYVLEVAMGLSLWFHYYTLCVRLSLTLILGMIIC